MNILLTILKNIITPKVSNAQKDKKLLFLSMAQFYPDQKGGAQQSTLTLFKELRKNGWQILVLCRSTSSSAKIEQKVKSFYATEFFDDFTCIRYEYDISAEKLLEVVTRHIILFKPKYLLGEFFLKNIEDFFYIAEKVKGIKKFCFIRTMEGIKELGSTLKIPKSLTFISNSQFTADEMYKILRKKTKIIVPFVDLKKVQVSTSIKKKYITFINPVWQKGVSTAIEIAEKMPEYDFLFVAGGWDSMLYDDTNPNITKIKTIKNINLVKYSKDVSEIYASTKILLVPSHFEETFGRVIIEAQSNGIPVIGSNRGNIPHTIGKGGFIVDDYKNAEAYIDIIKLLLNNQDVYKKRSAWALTQSQKKEFSLENQINKFISIIN